VVRELPSHCPSHAVPSAAQAVRAPRGAPVTGLQVPTLVLSLHASHCPLHAASQHTASTQNPDAHTASRAQECAMASFGMQTPAEQ
jgi:hypothetical protein